MTLLPASRLLTLLAYLALLALVAGGSAGCQTALLLEAGTGGASSASAPPPAGDPLAYGDEGSLEAGGEL